MDSGLVIYYKNEGSFQFPYQNSISAPCLCCQSQSPARKQPTISGLAAINHATNPFDTNSSNTNHFNTNRLATQP